MLKKKRCCIASLLPVFTQGWFLEIYFVPSNRPFFLFLRLLYALLLKIAWENSHLLCLCKQACNTFSNWPGMSLALGSVWDEANILGFSWLPSCLSHTCAFPLAQFPQNIWLLLNVLTSPKTCFSGPSMSCLSHLPFHVYLKSDHWSANEP